MKLFDAHCHLQDKRVIDKASQLISAALAVGVTNFAINGTSEVFFQKISWSFGHCYSRVYIHIINGSCLWSQKDWGLVKEMGETYPSVVPCFGLHPWFGFYMPDDFQLMRKVIHFIFYVFWFSGLLLIGALIGLITLKKFFETTPTAAVGEVSL